MIEACNFKGHEIEKTFVGQLQAKGFYVGRKVQLTKRISLNMTIEGTGEVQYTDLVKGTCGFVEGAMKDMPVVSFSLEGKKNKHCTAAIKTSNLTLDVQEIPAGEAASSSGSGGSGGSGGVVGGGKKGTQKGFEFLDGANDTIDVHTHWPEIAATKSIDMTTRNLHSKLGMTLAAIVESMPTYTTADFHLVSRNQKLEVWTARDFAAKEIMFAPESNEWKERVWSHTKSVLVKYGDMCQMSFTQHCLR